MSYRIATVKPTTRATRGGSTPLYRTTSGVTPELMAQLGFLDEAGYESMRPSRPAAPVAVADSQAVAVTPAPPREFSRPLPARVHPPQPAPRPAPPIAAPVAQARAPRRHWKMPSLSFPAFALPAFTLPTISLPAISLSQVRRALQPMKRSAAVGCLLSGLGLISAQIFPYQGLSHSLLAHHDLGARTSASLAFHFPTFAAIAASRRAHEIALEGVYRPVRARAGRVPWRKRLAAHPQRIHPVAESSMLRIVALAEPSKRAVGPLPRVWKPLRRVRKPLPRAKILLPLAPEQLTKVPEAPSAPWMSDNLPSLDPTQGGEITSGFGYRTAPYPEFHRGLDLAAPTGRPVLVSANGRVIYAGWKGGFGYKIEVDHGNGYVTWYGHLSKISVAVGERVTRGAVIGNVGSTGEATGPHLHYQIMRYGVAINPLPYLRAWGRTAENPAGG